MRQYVIIVRGRNVLMREAVKGIFARERQRVRRLGFVTTRVVVASDRTKARSLAIDAARKELESMPIANDPSDPPTFDIQIEDIQEHETHTQVATPSRGFTFYPDRSGS